MSLFNYISISDLHFGVNRLCPHRMLRSLITTITPHLSNKVDYFFVGGDVYERPLQANSEAAKVTNQFITWLCSQCAKYNIKLRVLLGTAYHDGQQCENFIHINNGLSTPADLRYWDKVAVHKEEGITFLAVPDNAAPTHAGVQAKVAQALVDAEVTSVDVGITHGLYDSHMLAGFGLDAHDSAYYLSIVDTLILNGHIHTSSKYKHLCTNGSFDRNRQGEEEPKGGWCGVIDVKKNTFTRQFMENKDAYTFFKHHLPESVADVGVAYENVVEALTARSITPVAYVSIVHAKTLDISALIHRLNQRYGGEIVFTSAKKKEQETQFETDKLALDFSVDEVTSITPGSIIDLTQDKLKRMGLDWEAEHERIIKELMNE